MMVTNQDFVLPFSCSFPEDSRFVFTSKSGRINRKLSVECDSCCPFVYSFKRLEERVEELIILDSEVKSIPQIWQTEIKKSFYGHV